MTRDEALRIRAIVERATESLDDQTASEGASLFPRLKYDGSLIKTGTRINWHGMLKRAAVDLWDTDGNTPDAAPALWSDIAYRAGIRIIPDVITAGTAFAKGEQGWRGDTLYESLIDANVWTPEQYPAGWALIN